jgi:hypothetical protein
MSNWIVTSSGKNGVGLRQRLAVITAAARDALGIPLESVSVWRSDGDKRLQTVVVKDVWIEQALPGKWSGWVLASRVMADRRGQPVIAEVRVFPYEENRYGDSGEWSAQHLGASARDSVPVGGLPATLVRRGLPIGEHIDDARLTVGVIGLLRGTSEPGSEFLDHVNPTLRAELAASGYNLDSAARKLRQAPGKLGAPEKRTRQDYARIALIYDDAVKAKESPIEAIQTAEGVTKAIARNLVKKARDRRFQFVPPAVKQGAKLPIMQPSLRKRVEKIAAGGPISGPKATKRKRKA